MSVFPFCALVTGPRSVGEEGKWDVGSLGTETTCGDRLLWDGDLGIRPLAVTAYLVWSQESSFLSTSWETFVYSIFKIPAIKKLQFWQWEQTPSRPFGSLWPHLISWPSVQAWYTRHRHQGLGGLGEEMEGVTQVGGCFHLLCWWIDNISTPCVGVMPHVPSLVLPRALTLYLREPRELSVGLAVPLMRFLTIHASSCLFGLSFIDVAGRSGALWSINLPLTLPFGTRCQRGSFLFCFVLFLMFIYFWDRQRDREAEREEDRGSEAGSAWTAVSLMWGSNSWTMRSWSELKSDAQLTEPPRRPSQISLG